MGLYRVLAGKHIEGDRVYSVGDIVDSKSDLAKLFNSPMSKKYEKVTQGELTAQEQEELTHPASAPPDDGLDTMSLDDLRKFAEAEKIPTIKGAKKDDLIRAIRTAAVPV